MPVSPRDRSLLARLLCRAAPFLATALLLAPSAAQGQTSTWQRPPQTSGDWFTASNWSGGVPTASRFALIDNGGTAALSSGAAVATGLRVGFNDSGSVSQTGGDLAIGFGPSAIGQFAGSFGEYRISGGSLTVARSLGIGVQGTGEFTQLGGEVKFNNDFYILGATATGKGTYELANGTLAVEGELTVGNFGEGLFVQSGGSATVGHLWIARDQQGTGRYELHEGTLNTARTTLGSGQSSFLHGAATHTTEGLDVEATGDGETAVYEMTDDASMLIARGLLVGGGSVATFNQFAGTTQVPGRLTVRSTKSATFNLFGGTLTSQNATIGSAGNGTFNQVGGVHVATGIFHVGETASSTANQNVYNLSGGHLDIQGPIYIGFRDSGVFNQTGGSNHIHDDLIIAEGGQGVYSIAGGTHLVDGDVLVGVQHGTQKEFEIIGGLGQIDIGGDFVLGPFGGQPLNRPVVELNFDSTGISTISVGGAAQIDGGRFLFTFGPDFAPQIGQQFLLLTADEGIFGNPIYSGIGTLGDQFDIVRTANTLVLVSLVPEPGSMVLAGLGCAGFFLANMRRRRKRLLRASARKRISHADWPNEC